MPWADWLSVPLAPSIDTSSKTISIRAKPFLNLMITSGYREHQSFAFNRTYTNEIKSNYCPGYLQDLRSVRNTTGSMICYGIKAFCPSGLSEWRDACEVEVSSQDTGLNHRRLSKPSQVPNRFRSGLDLTEQLQQALVIPHIFHRLHDLAILDQERPVPCHPSNSLRSWLDFPDVP